MDFQLVADTHTHALASGHAYSTLLENLHAAKAIGLSFLCYTEHGPAMEDAPRRFYFHNIKNLPDMVEGVGLLKGAEANICDYEGTLDLPEKDLAALDWVIASYHTQVIDPSTKEDATRGWLAVAKNPLVDVLGHCGSTGKSSRSIPTPLRCARAPKRTAALSPSFARSTGCRWWSAPTPTLSPRLERWAIHWLCWRRSVSRRN